MASYICYIKTFFKNTLFKFGTCHFLRNWRIILDVNGSRLYFKNNVSLEKLEKITVFNFYFVLQTASKNIFLFQILPDTKKIFLCTKSICYFQCGSRFRFSLKTLNACYKILSSYLSVKISVYVIWLIYNIFLSR